MVHGGLGYAGTLNAIGCYLDRPAVLIDCVVCCEDLAHRGVFWLVVKGSDNAKSILD